MKILLLSPQPFYQVRGTPIAIDLLVTTLSKQGHEIDLVTYHEGDSRQYPNVTHYRIRAFRWLNGIKPGFSVKKLLCSGLMFLKAFGLLRREKYDLIHANEEAVFMAWFFDKAFKTPYVYDMDSSLSDQMITKMPRLKVLGRLMTKLEAVAIRNSVGVLAVCEALCKQAVPHNSNVTLLTDVSMLERLKASANVIDLATTYPLVGTRFMYVGNLETYQGVDLMLDAFVVARKAKAELSLVIIGGDAKSIEFYQSKATQLGVEKGVYFVGPKPFDDLAEYMCQADVLLSPRIQGENTPMKIYNYMASDRALIATRIYSHTQVLNDDVAKLVNPDPNSLAQAMIELSSNQELRTRLAKNCRRYAEQHYSVASFERKVKEFFDTLAARLGPLTTANARPADHDG